jgi:hypothetical protein
MAKQKTTKRRAQVKGLARKEQALTTQELKKVKGGRDLAAVAKELDGQTEAGGPTAAMNQKIQE